MTTTIDRATWLDVKRLHERWNSLTPAERNVAVMLIDGRTNRQIAAQLFLSDRTIQSHITHALQKLQLQTRTQVAIAAYIVQTWTVKS